eukprot:2910497-Prymnesium_polylepis.1
MDWMRWRCSRLATSSRRACDCTLTTARQRRSASSRCDASLSLQSRPHMRICSICVASEKCITYFIRGSPSLSASSPTSSPLSN